MSLMGSIHPESGRSNLDPAGGAVIRRRHAIRRSHFLVGVSWLHRALVDADVVLGHAAGREPFLKTTANESAIQHQSAVDRIQSIIRLDSVASNPVIDHLRYRPTSKPNDGGVAGHCLDHDETERLR